MHLCELYNLTIGIPSQTSHLLFTEDSKTVKGLMAKYFEPYFKVRKSYTNKCTLINISKIGSKLENGSYDGALGAFEKKEIDTYLRAEIPFTDSEHVYFSYPVDTEKLFIFHVINRKELDEFEFKMQLVKCFDSKFILYYFLTFFIFFAFILIYNYIKSSFFKFKIILNVFKILKNINNKKLKFLSLIFFGLIWFNFFTKQIMINNINTTKVIVDTSQFITTEEKLFDNPLKAAWIYGETDLMIAKNAPKNTFLNKLYKFKNSNPLKVYEIKLDIKLIEDINNYFFLVKSYVIKLLINLIGSYQNKDGFHNSKPFYEVFSVLYINKNIEKKKKKFLFKLSRILSQSGCYAFTIKQVSNIKYLQGPNKLKIYTDLNSYIDDYTKFDSLKYENFHYILLVLVFFYNFLFYLFIFFYLLNKLM